MTAELRAQIIEEARTWIGTPYHHNARSKGVGVDCVQFIIAVYNACGLTFIGDADYSHDWHLHRSEERYLNGVARYGRKVDQPDPGDLALFKFGRCVSHGGLILPDGAGIIHSYLGNGVIISALANHRLAGRFHSFWSVIP
jgi:NlpC/P60 family putative phage cell wall peptidase